MGLGVGIFLLAIGAVLAFAIHVNSNGAVDINTVGYILMAAGGLGILLSLIFWSSWAGPGYFSRRQTTVDGPGTVSRTTTIDQT
jgi:hypothetical protein